MFRNFVTAAFLSVATPLAAQQATDISAIITERGLAAARQELQDATTAQDRFALGAVLFLQAIEKTLNTRWRYNLQTSSSLMMYVPVLRLPLPKNPEPEPFRADVVVRLFSAILDDMDAARDALAGIGDDDSVELILPLREVWFDVDGDGVRGRGEGLFDIAGMMLTRQMRSGEANPVIRFDTADAAWLAAYTHMLSAFSELLLAFDPTAQIERTRAAALTLDGFAKDTNFASGFDMIFGNNADVAAIAYYSLQQQPDATRTRALREHLLAMIRQNRVFWQRVDSETDDDAEWIPNPRQTSALGAEFPPQTGPNWLAVLQDAEDLLEGRKLIPFWRLRSGAGINLKRLLEDPVPVDIVGWVQGAALIDYVEEGERVSTFSWLEFTRMMRGNAILYALWLN